MDIKRKSKPDKKNQKNADLPVSVTFEQTVGLRLAAKSLQEHAPLAQKGLDVTRLLDGLQRGILASGFFDNQPPAVWVAIPAAYWQDITAKMFKSIRDNDKGEGAFYVSLKRFPEQYLIALADHESSTGLTHQGVHSRLVEAIKRGSQRREVRLVQNAAWSEYLQSMADAAVLSAAVAPMKKKKGRTEMPGWKLIYRMLASDLIVSRIESRSDVPIADLTKRAMAEASKVAGGAVHFPKPDVVGKEIEELFNFVDRKQKAKAVEAHLIL